MHQHTVAEREGNNSGGFTDFFLKNGSRLGHDLVSTVLFVSNSLDSGREI
jgi:hypothetical protein